jgi:NADH:ubiquinone oxidoreductase subunit E
MKTPARSPATQRWQRKLEKNIEKESRYLIPALQYVQSEAGYLPAEAMTAVALHLGVSEAKVFGVASFYSLFHFEPRGRNTVTVCRGTACHVRGSGALLAELEKLIGVQAGGTSEDMAFSLETVACFGSCALAPVVVVNGKVYGRQTAASVKKLIDDIRAEPASASAADVKRGKSGRRNRSRAAGAGKTS